MYFSRITLREDARRTRDFWTVFRNEYGLHQAVWQLFGDRPDRKRDFLYRIKDDGGAPVVYTLSERAPDAASPLWAVEAPKPFAPRVGPGTSLEFTLRANPVRTRDGKRHDVVMEEKRRLRDAGTLEQDRPSEPALAQEAGERWLAARATKGGFQLRSVRADGYRPRTFFKSRGEKPVRIATMDFTGILEVTDPGTFVDETLSKGIGPAKGFGCGLMLVRRV